jgi:pimeloyl-ACP methyl ester carboxylesterase
MIQQYWIVNGRRLFLAKHIPQTPVGVVLLLPGLGFSKNEHAYFYSKLARSICSDQLVIQLDYTGHGDSDGDFCDATVPVLIEDVSAIIEHCNHAYPEYPLTIVSRGIGTWLVPYSAQRINSWIVWNPAFTIPSSFIGRIAGSSGKADGLIEIADLPCSVAPAEARLFFAALGSDWWNILRGERFSLRQLESFRMLNPQILQTYMDGIDQLHFIHGSKWRYMNRRQANRIIYPGEEDFSVSPAAQDWAIGEIARLLSPVGREL